MNSQGFNQIFCWLQSQQFESASRLMELAGGKAKKRSEGTNFTSVFGVLEQKPLWKSGMKQMRQIFRTAKVTQMLGNADHLVLYMFHRIFDNLSTPLSFIPAGVYLPLIFNASVRKRNEGTNMEVLQTSSPQEVLLFFHVFHFVDELQSKNNLQFR